MPLSLLSALPDPYNRDTNCADRDGGIASSGNLCFCSAKRNRLFMAASQSLYPVFVETQGAWYFETILTQSIRWATVKFSKRVERTARSHVMGRIAMGPSWGALVSEPRNS